MANKIVDLDRLKDYANKESVLLGKKVKDQVIFDGTASGFVPDGSMPWKLGKLSGPLPIIEGEHYKVTIDGTVRADEECGEYDKGESCFYMADIGLAITSGGHVMDFTKARTTVNIKVEGTKRQLGTIDTLPNCNIVNGEGNFAVKTNNTFNDATGTFSVALGAGNIANAFGAVAEGIANDATGEYAHAEGYYNEASGNFSHAEGSETEATGEYTHAEGFRTAATFGCAHAEGFGSNASGESSHAEGNMTTASGACAHAEGAFTIASGNDSHAQGYLTVAASKLQSVRGAANVPDPDEKFADIIGMGDFDGTTVNHARNIEATTYGGDKFMLGDVYVGANDDSTGGTKVTKLTDFVPEYDTAATYNKNDPVIHDNKVYVAKEDGITGDWAAAKWEEKTVADTLRAKNVLIKDADKRYDSEDVEGALKEISDLNGYYIENGVICDRTIDLSTGWFNGYPINIFRSRPIVGKQYHVFFDDVEYTGVVEKYWEEDYDLTPYLWDGDEPYDGDYTIDCWGSIEVDNAALAKADCHFKVVGPMYVTENPGINSITNLRDGAGFGSLEAGCSVAKSSGAISFGNMCESDGVNSFTAGNNNLAEGSGSIVLGLNGYANENAQDAFVTGAYNIANQALQTIMGYKNKGTAKGDRFGQMVRGTYGIQDTENLYADIVGGGIVQRKPGTTSTYQYVVGSQKNIEATTWTGNKKLKGDVYVQCNDDSSGGVNICDTVKVTKSELDTLIADSKLIPGLLYQITDYTAAPPVTAFDSTYHYKAGDKVWYNGGYYSFNKNDPGFPPYVPAIPDDPAHNPGEWYAANWTAQTLPAFLVIETTNPFDVVIEAIGKNKLSCNASAVPHGTDTSFADRDITQWKIIYDIKKHAITSLTDENNCTAPYDHIHIKFKRWATTDTAPSVFSTTSITGNYAYSTTPYRGGEMKDAWPWVADAKYSVNTSSFVATPTFGAGCKNITIHPLNRTVQNLDLPNITFGPGCESIDVGAGSYDITIGGNCKNIRLGEGCYSMIIGPNCERHSFSEACSDIIMRYSLNNSFGPQCSRMILSAWGCSFGPACTAMELHGTLPAVENKLQQPENLSFAGSNHDIYLTGAVHCCSFLERASQVWIDTTKTTKEADGASTADGYNWFKWATFEPGFNMRPGKEDSAAAGAVLALNDSLFVNSKCGNKRIYQDCNNTYICAWYDGLTLKGARGTLQNNATPNTWTAL